MKLTSRIFINQKRIEFFIKLSGIDQQSIIQIKCGNFQPNVKLKLHWNTNKLNNRSCFIIPWGFLVFYLFMTKISRCQNKHSTDYVIFTPMSILFPLHFLFSIFSYSSSSSLFLPLLNVTHEFMNFPLESFLKMLLHLNDIFIRPQHI